MWWGGVGLSLETCQVSHLIANVDCAVAAQDTINEVFVSMCNMKD